MDQALQTVFFGVDGFRNRVELLDVIDSHDPPEGVSGQLLQESFGQLIVIFGEQLSAERLGECVSSLESRGSSSKTSEMRPADTSKTDHGLADVRWPKTA